MKPSKKRDISKDLVTTEKNLGQFLDRKDVEDFKKLKSELQDTWVKKQIFRTETEMRVSVLNDLKFPTPGAKYWQCVREQNVFMEQLMYLSFDYREIIIDIKQLENKISKEKDKLKKEKLKIELDRKIFSKANAELVGRDRMREIREWSKLKEEQVKDDPHFNRRNVNDQQKESLPLRLMHTLKYFDKAKDANGAKNIAAQVMTAERLKKEGILKVGNPSVKKMLNSSSKPK